MSSPGPRPHTYPVPGAAMPPDTPGGAPLVRVVPLRPRLTRWLLASALTLHAVAALAQPVLIGGYLDGRFDLIGAHGVNGSLLPGLAFLSAVAAVAYWARRGAAWPALSLVVLWAAEFAQMVLGYTRVLWVHVPLGVAIVGAAAALAVWAWTPAAGRARTGWWA